MPTIFASTPGRVIRVATSVQAVRATIRFSEEFGYRTHGCVIVEAAIAQDGNFQVSITVSDLIYIDTFGDDPVPIVISGYAFLEVCSGNDVSVTSGLDGALDYYNQNRLSKRRQPIVILVGTKKFQGFLVGSEVKLLAPEAGLASFSFKFLSLPQ